MERNEKSGSSVLRIVDNVRTFKPISDGYQVTFEKHASRYYLKSSNPEFGRLESLLNIAEKTGTTVNLSINAETLEILSSIA